MCTLKAELGRWLSKHRHAVHRPDHLSLPHMLEGENSAGQWWHMPLISALRRQRQEDLHEFKVSLVYKS